MGRVLVVVAAIAALAAPGCRTAGPERAAADGSRLLALRTQWRREEPGAIVLEVAAAGRGLVAMAGGRDEGLAPGLLMGVCRDGEWLATVRVLKVDRELTQALVVDGEADAVRAGDAAVYLPVHR
jgi:hypothetical protein